MAEAIVEARSLLSVLVTLIGRVSVTRPVCFLGMRKSKPKLKPAGGGCPEQRMSRTATRRGPANSGAALHAAKGIPSGPEAELFDRLIAERTSSKEGLESKEVLTRFVYPLRKFDRARRDGGLTRGDHTSDQNLEAIRDLPLAEKQGSSEGESRR
jgi:hypothetical protein